MRSFLSNLWKPIKTTLQPIIGPIRLDIEIYRLLRKGPPEYNIIPYMEFYESLSDGDPSFRNWIMIYATHDRVVLESVHSDDDIFRSEYIYTIWFTKGVTFRMRCTRTEALDAIRIFQTQSYPYDHELLDNLRHAIRYTEGFLSTYYQDIRHRMQEVAIYDPWDPKRYSLHYIHRGVNIYISDRAVYAYR